MRTQRTRFIPFVLAATALWLVAAGCSDDPFAPYEPEINNEAGTFQLQATGVEGVSLTRSYAWTSEAATANINQSTTVDRGTATLRIFDGEGTQIYERSLASNGTYESDAGTGTDWTIRIILTDYTGTVNFRVESP